MQNFKLLEEIFDYMVEDQKSTFVDDFQDWNVPNEVKGFHSVSSMEGNALVSDTTGEKFEPQYASIRLGNDLNIELRRRCGRTTETDKKLKLSDLFNDIDFVVITSGEVLRALSPFFNRRSELIVYIAALQEYCRRRRKLGKPVPWYWEGDMIDIAIYLYQNCEDKIDDKCVYDRI